MYGLEYLLLFGVPGNKWEIMDGRSRWVLPFKDRDFAKAHFAEWSRTLERWRGVKPVANEATNQDGSPRPVVRFGGAEMSRYPGPIELLLPIDFEVFDALYESFWQRDLWPGQEPGKETGRECSQQHHDVRLNLWKLFGAFCEAHGGIHCGRTAITLDDRNAVEPDQFYFQATRQECLLNGDYFHGVPRLIAEVLSPATRAIDRGPRMEVYRRAGVANLWLLDPLEETLDEYALEERAYRSVGRYGLGQTFHPVAFPETRVEVDRLFDTQQKRHGWGSDLEDADPVPQWLVPAERRVGLEALFFLGHPEHRYEVWDNRAACMLAFGSSEEATLRFGHFLEEICRWEQAPLGRASEMEPGVEVAEVGRFQLSRRGRMVRMDVGVDVRKYRELMRVWSERGVWDWGGE